MGENKIKFVDERTWTIMQNFASHRRWDDQPPVDRVDDSSSERRVNHGQQRSGKRPRVRKGQPSGSDFNDAAVCSKQRRSMKGGWHRRPPNRESQQRGAIRPLHPTSSSTTDRRLRSQPTSQNEEWPGLSKPAPPPASEQFPIEIAPRGSLERAFRSEWTNR